MANEIRARANLVSGTLSVGLSNVDTTMSSAGLANLPAITAANHAVIVIENEIIFVTAHTAAATTATILRAQEGTAGAAHSTSVAWVHGPVVSDYDSVLGYAQAVANQAGIAAGPTDLTSLTVTVTVPYAGHRVRVSSNLQLLWSDQTTGHQIDVLEDGVAVGRIFSGGEFNANIFTWASGAFLKVPTAGSHTYKLTATRYAGAGTMTVSAGAAFPASILVEDLGPAL